MNIAQFIITIIVLLIGQFYEHWTFIESQEMGCLLIIAFSLINIADKKAKEE